MKRISGARIAEIFPSAIVWLTFFVIIVISFVWPIGAVYFIIVFAVYWIVRLFYMLVWLFISWFKFRHDIKIDWLARVKELPKNYLDYYHIITLPTYKEPYEVVERTFNELLKCEYPKDKMILVLGGEAGDQENFLAIAEKIRLKFNNSFKKLIVTVHPRRPDELPGKGSNVHYMEERLKLYVDQEKLPYEKLIVSCFDIETLPHPQYFSYLTYKYLTHPNPTRASYQPLVLYNNNVWESNPIVRVVASSTTFWLLTDMSRPERLFTFSSHSMPYQMIIDVGGHEKTIVSEDSRISMQAIVHYDGDYEVVPMFITVSMDTVYIGKFWQSIKDQYKQMRRWAWGVEHFPWLWSHFFGAEANRKIPLVKRLRYLWIQGEGMYSWATAPLLILIVGRLPLLLADGNDKATAFMQNAPVTLERLMGIGMIGLILNAILYAIILPKKPVDRSILNYFIMLAQWIMFPFTMIIFGSIPAIESQTRLLLGGKYRLGFWVTGKKVISK
jgi:cellulose synthase/poly-beta-1,6-N-acetylglucosamine synthase-like glycosyltransferase